MVDVASGFEQSIYDDRHTAKGETSILQVRSDALRQPPGPPCFRTCAQGCVAADAPHLELHKQPCEQEPADYRSARNAHA